MSIFRLALSLFLLMDSIGKIPLIFSRLKKMEAKRRRKIIAKELFRELLMIALIIFLAEHISYSV